MPYIFDIISFFDQWGILDIKLFTYSVRKACIAQIMIAVFEFFRRILKIKGFETNWTRIVIHN